MSAPLGHPRLHLRRTDSTNERARALAAAGAPHGTLVTAAEQTAGRGRQGRRWSAPANSALLMSLLLRDPPALLPLIAAVAVCEVAGEEALIKWPNDIVVAPFAKLAGILVESRPQEGWAVLGIGVNVAVRIEELPPELWSTAATLGRRRRRSSPRSSSCSRHCSAAWMHPPRRSSRPGGHGTHCADTRSRGRTVADVPRESTVRDGWSCGSPTVGTPRWVLGRSTSRWAIRGSPPARRPIRARPHPGGRLT